MRSKEKLLIGFHIPKFYLNAKGNLGALGSCPGKESIIFLRDRGALVFAIETQKSIPAKSAKEPHPRKLIPVKCPDEKLAEINSRENVFLSG